MADNYSENHGANIVACAEYLYNVLWEFQRDVAGWKYTFLKGNRYRIPYGQPVDEGEYIGYPADINTFLSVSTAADTCDNLSLPAHECGCECEEYVPVDNQGGHNTDSSRACNQ